jgi:hypothetical protein
VVNGERSMQLGIGPGPMGMNLGVKLSDEA